MSLAAAAGLLACPACGEPLDVGSRPVTCANGHSYDVARQGYLNLLGGPQPANADTAPMLDARARLLGSGAYDPLLDAVAEAARGEVIVDAGTGTGHYLAAVLDRAPDRVGLGLDVSVAAAKRAATRHPRLAAVVADTWRPLPVRRSVADTVLCIFAPRNPAEFARILTPSGLLVVVTPNPGHLASVRAAGHLLDIEPDKAERLLATLAGAFSLSHEHHVRRAVDATPEQVRDLVAMGPNAFHTPDVPDTARVELDVTLRVFVRE